MNTINPCTFNKNTYNLFRTCLRNLHQMETRVATTVTFVVLLSAYYYASTSEFDILQILWRQKCVFITEVWQLDQLPWLKVRVDHHYSSETCWNAWNVEQFCCTTVCSGWCWVDTSQCRPIDGVLIRGDITVERVCICSDNDRLLESGEVQGVDTLVWTTVFSPVEIRS